MMLQGVNPAMMMSDGGPPLPDPVVYRDHHVANNGRATIPTVMEGDLLIALERGYASGNAVLPVPAGWTYVGAHASGGDGVAMAVKVADGTETGPISLLSKSGSHQAMIVSLNGAINGLGSIIDSDAQSGSGNPAVQLKNATTLGDKPFLVIGGYGNSNSGGIGDFTGATPDTELTYDTGAATLLMKFKFYNFSAIPADITIDMPDLGRNGLVSGIVELT